MLRAQPGSRGTRAPPTQAKPLLDKCVEDTRAEAGCLYYGWTIKEDGSKLFCRETYVDGAAAGHHLSCVAKSGALGEALELLFFLFLEAEVLFHPLPGVGLCSLHQTFLGLYKTDGRTDGGRERQEGCTPASEGRKEGRKEG